MNRIPDKQRLVLSTNAHRFAAKTLAERAVFLRGKSITWVRAHFGINEALARLILMDATR